MPFNRELKDYYEARFEMFASKGWNDLMEDISNMEKTVRDIANCNEEKMLHFRKGQLDILSWMKGLKEMSESAYEGLKDEGTV